MWWQSKNTVRPFSKTLSFIQSKELEFGALVIIELLLLFQGIIWDLLEASIVLPHKALKIGWAISQLWWRSGLNLLRRGGDHVICAGPAPSRSLIFLDKRIWGDTELLDVHFLGKFVITQGACHGKVLRTSVKNNSDWLTNWWTNIQSSHVNSVVSAFEWNLKLDLVSHINRRICFLWDQLRCLHTLLGFYIRGCLYQSLGIKLSIRFLDWSSLVRSELRIAQIFDYCVTFGFSEKSIHDRVPVYFLLF